MAATLTIKNIPVNLYELLKKNAAKNHRSINGEIISIIENTFISKPFLPEDYLANARILRDTTSGFLLTEDVLKQAKSDGRL
ncbi:MAG: Arc family DNA-binding protein [bacterium]|nr:Arc family DNA-binding protein [bacterium]